MTFKSIFDKDKVFEYDLFLRHLRRSQKSWVNIQLEKSRKFWMSREELVLAQLAPGKQGEYQPTKTNTISNTVTNTNTYTNLNTDTKQLQIQIHIQKCWPS